VVLPNRAARDWRCFRSYASAGCHSAGARASVRHRNYSEWAPRVLRQFYALGTGRWHSSSHIR
jgi:hypothetical protein